MNDQAENTVVRTTFKEKQDDPGFLVSKGRFNGTDEERKSAERRHIRKLANAIFMAMRKYGYASIRSIGARAAYNAMRAVAEASRYCSPKGIELVWKVSYDEGNIGELRDTSHVRDVSALVIELRSFKDWADEQANESAQVSVAS